MSTGCKRIEYVWLSWGQNLTDRRVETQTTPTVDVGSRKPSEVCSTAEASPIYTKELLLSSPKCSIAHTVLSTTCGMWHTLSKRMCTAWEVCKEISHGKTSKRLLSDDINDLSKRSDVWALPCGTSVTSCQRKLWLHLRSWLTAYITSWLGPPHLS